ncbi:MAG: Crp/Fnr family transcriptional regulator [Pseudomonadota bacterium]
MREYAIGTLIDFDPGLGAPLRALLAEAGSPLIKLPGNIIYHQNDPATDIFLLSEGRAKSVLTQPSGEATLLRLHLPQSLLGLSALSSHGQRDADAIAMTPVELVAIPVARFRHLMATNTDLTESVIRTLVDRMSDFHHRVAGLVDAPIRQRLAAAMMSLSRPVAASHADAHDAPIALTQQDLADLIGARRPTVSSELKRLESAELIARTTDGIVVRDATALRRLAFGG